MAQKKKDKTEEFEKNLKEQNIHSPDEEKNTFSENSDVDDINTDDDVNVVRDEAILEELNTLKKEYGVLLENLKKERAEFVNFRQRSNVEKIDLEKFVATKILTEIFPSLDSFDMFFMTLEQQKETEDSVDTEKISESAKMIQRQLLSAFFNLGLEEFSPKGESFDPNSMEAIGVDEVDGVEEEVVHQVYQKGYRLGTKILRPARVMVHKPKNVIEN